MTGTTSPRQLHRREAGWEGGRRQSRDPGTRSASEAGRLGRASAIWQSPMPSKGTFRRRGGRAGKLLALSAEVSAAVLRCPAAVMADPRVVWDSSVREDVVRRGGVSRGQGTAASARTSFAVEKSAEAKVPAGIGIAGKDEREAERQDVCASGRRSDRGQPFGSLGGRVKREAQRRPARAQQGPAPHATAAHPPRRACGSGSRPEDLVDALRGVGQNAGAPGIDGVSTEQLRAVVERPLATAPLRARGGHLPAQPVRR
jgi:hypothetical protein